MAEACFLQESSSKSIAFPKEKKKIPVLFFSGWKWKKLSEERSASLSNPVIYLYSALGTGNFWFLAQVFDREVKAEVSKRRSIIQDNKKWFRTRAPPIDTPSIDLHV